MAQLARERYEGANHTHLTELLSEREGIDLSRPTVRRILTRAGIGSPRSRRIPQHRFRRQRMPQAGMLIQLDGSHHARLEDRGPKFALLLAVDDATSAVVNAVFKHNARQPETAAEATQSPPARCRNWGSGRSSPRSPPKPRAVWNARRGLSRTGCPASTTFAESLLPHWEMLPKL